ncbi:MAG: hypothetical protein DRJ03_13100 [Chloroflexi bacterium]|nr:MAG: hypothetical protein DRJ03_13100 [Chloroflexota bacterium]
MELNELLSWILSGGGAGIIAYWLMDHLPFLIQLSSEYKRYASLIIAGILAVAGYLVAVSMGYQPQPETIKAWVETLFSVIGVAIGLSQFIHGRRRLRIQR